MHTVSGCRSAPTLWVGLVWVVAYAAAVDAATLVLASQGSTAKLFMAK